MQVVLYEYENGNDNRRATYPSEQTGLKALEKLYNEKYKGQAGGYYLDKKDFAIYRGLDWQIAWLEEK